MKRFSNIDIIRHFVELGVHIGSDPVNFNPALSKYIIGNSSGFLVIDVRHTLLQLKRALRFIFNLSKQNGRIFFVNTDYEGGPLSFVLKYFAKECKQPCISTVWINGIITNWERVFSRMFGLLFLRHSEQKFITVFYKIIRLLEKRRLDISFEKHMKSIYKYLRFLSFFAHYRLTKQIPEALFLINPLKIRTAIAEYNRLQLPIISVLDTDSSSNGITYGIPANDDSLFTAVLFSRLASKAVMAGQFAFFEQFRVHNPLFLRRKIASRLIFNPSFKISLQRRRRRSAFFVQRKGSRMRRIYPVRSVDK